MVVAILFILEEQIGLPDTFWVGENEVVDATASVVKLQPIIVPLLTKGDLAGVFLWRSEGEPLLKLK